MHKLTQFEKVSGVAVCVIAVVIIVLMIAGGFKIASDAKVKEAEKSVERRARQLARQMVREALKDVKITVTQHIAVIEDDLGKGVKQ